MAQHESDYLPGNPAGGQPRRLPDGSEPQEGPGASVMSLAVDAMPDSTRGRLIAVGIALAVALLSFFLLGAWASSPETYAGAIASLDEKRDTVMGLVGGSTGVSGAITLLPGDAGTPIAEKLLDIGADFGIVLGAIYLEKYLLTILGAVAFKVLVPLACLLVAGAALLSGRGVRYREMFLGGAARLALFALVAVAVVPVSVFVSDAIDATYQQSVATTLASAEQVSSSAGAAEGTEGAEGEQGAQADAASPDGADGASEGGFNVLEFVQAIPENVTGAVEDATRQGQETLNNFIETLAVMIVTSCVIPLLVLVFFLWLAKTILGLNVNVPMQAFAPRSLRRMHRR